jgi:2-phosphosulfolactate phosphatase
MRKSVVIDCFPENVKLYREGYAVVVIDVIRATTVAITAAATGRRCFPVPSVEAAWQLQPSLDNPLMVGEIAGTLPEGFDMNNSPVDMSARTADISRPIILVSSSGTKLIHAARDCEITFLACFRNYAFLSAYLREHHTRVAVIGAGTRGEFREEDQMCCSWIAENLMQAGFEPENDKTVELTELWSNASPNACTAGKSADYLRRSGQLKDLDFTIARINDINCVFVMREGEVIKVPPGELAEPLLLRPTSNDAFRDRIG